MNLKSRFLPIFLLLSIVSTLAPCQVQWAEKVLSVSSEYGGGIYKSKEVLGKPDVFPQLSTLAGAWSPQPGSESAQITVGFGKEVDAAQVALFMAGGAQYISSVVLISSDLKEKALDLSSLYPITEEPRVLQLFTRKPIPAVALRVQFNLHHAKKPLMLDAVAVSTDKNLVVAEVAVDSSWVLGLKKQSLTGLVNSACDELNGIQDQTGQWLLFTRKNCSSNREGALSHSGDIYLARKVNTSWEGIRSFSDKANNFYNNEPAGIARNGATVYISGQFGFNGTTPIVLAFLQTDNMAANHDPLPVLIKDFYSFDEKENTFYVHPDEQVLLLSADRREGEGRTDLYVSLRQPDGTFGTPQWLGPDVNSSAFEFAPYLSDDMQRLYFASYGFAGYGSADVYVSYRLDNSWSRWTTPLNLGPVVNSSKFDAYFRESGPRNAIVSSTYNSMGYGDLYSIEPIVQETMECQPVPTTSIHDSLRLYPQVITWNPEVQARISVRLADWVLADSAVTGGSFRCSYTGGHQLSFTILAGGYLPYSDTLLTRVGGTSLDVSLVPVQAGASYVLENIQFLKDSTELLPQSEATLNTLAEWLRAQPSFRIEIMGHTEPGGSKGYNKRLSLKRAEAVRNYLIKQGVGAGRLLSVGYGGEKPLTNRPKEESRRVEFKILP